MILSNLMVVSKSSAKKILSKNPYLYNSGRFYVKIFLFLVADGKYFGHSCSLNKCNQVLKIDERFPYTQWFKYSLDDLGLLVMTNIYSTYTSIHHIN